MIDSMRTLTPSWDNSPPLFRNVYVWHCQGMSITWPSVVKCFCALTISHVGILFDILNLLGCNISRALSNSNAQEKQERCGQPSATPLAGPVDQISWRAQLMNAKDHDEDREWRNWEVVFSLSHQKPTLRGWRNAQITSNASSVSTNSQQLTNWFELFLSERADELAD